SNYARLKSIDDTKLENTAAENVESAEILEAKESYMKEILKLLKQEPDIDLLKTLLAKTANGNRQNDIDKYIKKLNENDYIKVDFIENKFMRIAGFRQGKLKEIKDESDKKLKLLDEKVNSITVELEKTIKNKERIRYTDEINYESQILKLNTWIKCLKNDDNYKKLKKIEEELESANMDLYKKKLNYERKKNSYKMRNDDDDEKYARW
ncbi:17809_t:CDS:2, partial [Gigaspora rosea]